MAATRIQGYHAYILLMLPSSLSRQDLAVAVGANSILSDGTSPPLDPSDGTYQIHTHHWMEYSQRMVS
jgi:hypothetical protein